MKLLPKLSWVMGWWYDLDDELWRRLGNSWNLYHYFQLWLIVVKSWYYIGVCLILGLYGGMMLNWNVLTMLWGWLRCMWYKDGENYQCALICYEMLMCYPHLYELWWKDYTHAILIELLMMMIIQGIDPITYINLWWLIKVLKTFQKGL